jgi:hypothetical protein
MVTEEINELNKKLLSAAYAGDVALCKALLEGGASANFAIPSGWTALHGAATRGSEETCALLIDHGADLRATAHVNGRKFTPMQLAVQFNSVSVVDYFVTRHGEDLGQFTADGITLDVLAQELAGSDCEMVGLLRQLRSQATARSVAGATEGPLQRLGAIGTTLPAPPANAEPSAPSKLIGPSPL